MPRQVSPICCRLFCATLVLVLISQTAISRSAMANEKTPNEKTPDDNKTVTLELDHASICGSNLDTLRQAFTDIGLTPDFGGAHGDGGTQMALVGFDDGTYLELIAPIKPGVTAGSDWAKFMSEQATPCAWAVTSNVLLQEVDRLKKAGIPVTAPEAGSRKRPDGMSVEWKTASASSGAAGSTLPFIIEDQTPRAWRVQTSASAQGAPVSGIENVVLGVSNLDASIALFRKAYGWSPPVIENQRDFGKLAYFPGEPVILAAPNGGGWLSDHLAKFGESPVAYLLNTRDFAAATKKYKLSSGRPWFGQKVGWFDPAKLKGVRLGVIGE